MTRKLTLVRKLFVWEITAEFEGDDHRAQAVEFFDWCTERDFYPTIRQVYNGTQLSGVLHQSARVVEIKLRWG